MANIAEGWFLVESDSPALLECLNRWVASQSGSNLFSYGSMGDGPAVELGDTCLEVQFTARWSCTATFDALAALLDEAAGFEERGALISADISGSGREYATFYKENIEKAAGSDTIERELIDLESMGLWGALEVAGAFELKKGERRENLGECLVTFECHDRESIPQADGAPHTKWQIGVYFQCGDIEITVVLDGLGKVTETHFMDEDENTDPEENPYYGEMLEDLSTIESD